MRVILVPAALAALLLPASQAAAQQADMPSAEAAGLRLLTWPGKAAPQGRRRHASERSAPEPRTPPPTPASLPTSIYEPARTAVRAAEAQPSAPTPRPAALPASIYAPPPAPVRTQTSASAAPVAAQPVVQRQARAQATESDYTRPRFYSLHRAYGLKPDPIPLSPQFFATPTPDLAQPPPPPPRTVVTANGQVVRTVNSDDTAVN